MARRPKTPSRPPKPKPEPKQGGRPPYQPTAMQRSLVRNAKGLLGLSNERIARMMGISVNTLREHFKDDIEMGGDLMLSQVAVTGYQMAVGRPARYDDNGRVITEEIKPNQRAVEFILRTKGGFRERVPVASTPIGSASDKAFEVDLADCTDEELDIMERMLERKIARGSNGPDGG